MAAFEIVHRGAVPYAAISLTTTMAELGTAAPPLVGQVFDWLAGQGVRPAGPPFWKYEVVDMARSLQLQVGVTTVGPIAGDGRVHAGELPAGRYLQTMHRGHPATLERATGDLLAYAQEEGLRFAVVDGPRGQRWAARLELYLTDPAQVPDLDRWETQLAFALAD